MDKTAAEKLIEELDKVVNRHAHEFDVTIMDLVGALEAVKFRVLRATYEHKPENED